jgi:hypothetical protein
VTFLDARPRLSERGFEQQVIAYATLMGWHVWKDRATNAPRRCDACGSELHVARNPAGWPDLVLIRRPRIVFLELKAQRGGLTDAQAACIGELTACGQEVYLARPSDWSKLERLLR